ncbi:beta-lactamase family protein [Parasalinivibrio latis]|uniref:serine hydrolase n=1 Tax=Parasalinivibrio latis TaxID=2952610 RepID=UPI0030E1DBA3
MAVYTKSMHDRGYMSKKVSQMNGRKTYYALDDCSYFSPFNSAGLLGASVTAIATFVQSFLPQYQSGKGLLKKETVEDIWKVVRQDPMTGSAIGLGWFDFNVPGYGTFWGHDGGGPGILSRVMVDPKTGNGVVLLINNFFVDFDVRNHLIKKLCAFSRSN